MEINKNRTLKLYREYIWTKQAKTYMSKAEYQFDSWLEFLSYKEERIKMFWQHFNQRRSWSFNLVQTGNSVMEQKLYFNRRINLDKLYELWTRLSLLSHLHKPIKKCKIVFQNSFENINIQTTKSSCKCSIHCPEIYHHRNFELLFSNETSFTTSLNFYDPKKIFPIGSVTIIDIKKRI